MNRIFGLAVAIAVAAAGSAQAAIVTYAMGASDGTGQTYIVNCDGQNNCTDSFASVGGLTLAATIGLDTAAGMGQFGDPQNGAGTTILFGGTLFGPPSGGSFGFSSSAGQPITLAPLGMLYRTVFYGQANNMQFTMENQLTDSFVDTLTGDTIVNSTRTLLSTVMYGGGGGLVNVGGEWVPNPSLTQDGQLYVQIEQSTERLNSNNERLSISYLTRDWYSGTARFLSTSINNSTPVPEPGTVGLLGLGVVLLAAGRRARKA